MKVTLVAFVATARAALIAFVLATLVAIPSGCGGGNDDGDGDKKYEGDGYSFTYPEDWDEQDPEAASQGGDVISSAYVGQDNTDVLAVLLYRVPVSITEANIDEYADDVFEQAREIYEGLDGELTARPTPVTMDGLPGFRYEGSLVNVDGVPVQARVTDVFDEMTEYYLYCQFTPEGAEEMKRGCDQAVESFEVE
jgi:hypothetical protein